MTTEPQLTLKQEKFARAYVANGGNGTAAAEEAGYKRADIEACRLLRSAKVKDRIAELMKPVFDRYAVTADRVIREIAKVAFASLEDVLFITEDGDPYIDLSKASPEALAALEAAEIEDFVDSRERDEEGAVVARAVRRVKIKNNSKLKALDLLARHLKLLTDKVEVTVSDDFAATLAKARKRVEQRRQSA